MVVLWHSTSRRCAFLSIWHSIMLIYSLIIDDARLPMMVDVAYDRFCLCIYSY